MAELSNLAETWRKALVGTEVKGTVTDPESGAEAAYHLRCSAVSWSGFGERIAIVWDDLITGTYRRWELAPEQLENETAETLSEMLRQQVEASLADTLAVGRYDGLEGEEL